MTQNKEMKIQQTPNKTEVKSPLLTVSLRVKRLMFSSNNFFKKTTEIRTSTYYCCGKIDHKSYECNLRKHHKVSNLGSKLK